jgi:hypothetical protein
MTQTLNALHTSFSGAKESSVKEGLHEEAGWPSGSAWFASTNGLQIRS